MQLIRFWDKDFNELTKEEAEAMMAFDFTSVAVTVESDD